MNNNNNILDAFGLTNQQTRILFSIEYQMTFEDIKETKNVSKEMNKKVWLENWKNSVESLLNAEADDSDVYLYTDVQLIDEIKLELEKSSNQTWYHMILLEAIAFEAYTALGDAQENKAYKLLKFNPQLDFLKEKIVTPVGVGSENLIERYDKAYTNALNTATGKNQKIIIRGLIIVASSAIIAATSGALAGPIAVFLGGSKFAGLSGMALVNASLAALGGGAVAVGGAGVFGGTLAIIGGGALLGAASGSAFVTATITLAKESPEIIITQGAKLTVVLREIILNNQHDIVIAQNILENLKSQILDMNNILNKMRLERNEDKKTIQNLRASITALEKLFHSNEIFTSSFEIGLDSNPKH